MEHPGEQLYLTNMDTDNDKLSDFEEWAIYGTSPRNDDSDCDGINDKDDPEPTVKYGATFTIWSADASEAPNWKIIETPDPGPAYSTLPFDDSNFSPALYCNNPSIKGVWSECTGLITAAPYNVYVRGVYSLPEAGARHWARITKVHFLPVTDDETRAVDFLGDRVAGGAPGNPQVVPAAWYDFNVNVLAVDGKIVFGVAGANTMMGTVGAMNLNATVTYDYYYSVDSCP